MPETVPDPLFADAELAALYDPLCPRSARDDFEFYLPYLMEATAVLDIGCGTGMLLHWARELGHAGLLCGLDPAAGMLAHARGRPDVEWRLGTLQSYEWQPEFELAVMTGHAFQVLLTDQDVRAALLAVRSALVDGGRFAFETRNPAAREWERWDGRVQDLVDAAGRTFRMHTDLEESPGPGLVRFTHTFFHDRWPEPKKSTSTLRFLELDELRRLLGETGWNVEELHGDWDRGPVTDASPELIVIARRV